jgi:hypothetical protein
LRICFNGWRPCPASMAKSPIIAWSAATLPSCSIQVCYLPCIAL